MAYTQSFETLSGSVLTVSVSGVTTDADMPLAAEPFETEEADDVDVFLPVRTQSGYLRMLVASSAARTAWRQFIPTGATEKRVTLTNAQNELLWQGYVQTGTYGMQYPADYEEFELPVTCPLSVLEAIDMDTTPPGGNGVLTFAELLAYIFGKLTTAGTVINNYYFQGTTTAVAARLGMKVIYGNFLDTDSHGTVKAKYSCCEVLEEVCKFFGYSVRMCGDCVYFSTPAVSGAAWSRKSSLTDSGVASVSASTFNISDAMLASTDQQEEVEPGMKRITVKSDINKLDNLIEVPYDEIYDRYNTGEVRKMVWSVDYYDHDIYYAVCEPNVDNGSITYENDAISMTLRTVNVSSDDRKIYGRFLVFDDQDVGNVSSPDIPESKMSYNWQKCIDVFHSYLTPADENTPKFTIESKQEFVINDGVLYINFKCKWVSAWIGDKKATAKLQVGNLYWVGTYYPKAVTGHAKGWEGQWQATPGTFTLYFTADGALNTRQSISDPQYNGCGIPVTNTMRGTVHFEIVDVKPTTTMFIPINGFLSMVDFEIGFVRGAIEEKKYHGNEYTKPAGQFHGTDTIDLIFACDVEYGPDNYKRHMPAGLGYVLDGTTEKPLSTIPSLTNTGVIAEEQLADIMAAYHNHTHRVVTLELLSNLLGNITPRQMSTGLESMHPVSISHQWRDDITRIKLIQI